MQRSSEENSCCNVSSELVRNFVIFHPIQKLGNGECKLGVHRTQIWIRELLGICGRMQQRHVQYKGESGGPGGVPLGKSCAVTQRQQQLAWALPALPSTLGRFVCHIAKGKETKNNTFLKKQPLLKFVLNLLHLDINLVSL
jgi:hypothetical protein